jgi:hypothetical protein
MKAKGPGVGRSVSADENSAKRTKATVERERDERIKAKAMIRKVEGLAYGRYGYPYEPQAAKELNEFMIMRGDVREFLKSEEGAKLVSTPANLIIEYAS